MIYSIFKITLTIILSGIAIYTSGQEKKRQYEIKKAAVSPLVDGKLDDEAWRTCTTISGFIEVEPFFGKPAPYDTHVKLIYDDAAIYVGAYMKDVSADSIMKELSRRDEIHNTDFFGVYLDPFNDYRLSYAFFVTSAGVQVDRKITMEDEDGSWNAVWDSETDITDSGWMVEYKIPWSALRFPGSGNGAWGLQLARNMERLKEVSSWNPVDKNIDGLNNQAGIMTGIRDIDPPLRLSFVPYGSLSLQKAGESSSPDPGYNFGMDIKYGLSESYTVDMTLIPDFGQVQSDDKVYNLTPFEIYYEEKRPFFTEGTELFNKGDVFYSRRIGSVPSGFHELEYQMKDHEKIVHNPRESQLINATKLTGKSGKNLAIGVFNAMTSNTWADVEDTVTSVSRRVITEPFTNYNMFVLEQALKNNSYIGLFNTNVYKPNERSSANVSGTDFKFTNKKNIYGVEGLFILTQKYNKLMNPEYGHSYSIEMGKISGKFKYSAGHSVKSDTYDPNDMGYSSMKNRLKNVGSFEYNIYKPVGQIIESHNGVDIEQDNQYKPFKFSSLIVYFENFTTLKNYLSLGLNGKITPLEQVDFFEPRVTGMMFNRPPGWQVSGFYSPDYRKNFVLDIFGGYGEAKGFDRRFYSIALSPRIRINDKTMIVCRSEFEKVFNDHGYVYDTLNGINHVVIFGRRDLNTFENTITTEYRINNRAVVNLKVRHYWITGKYDRFFDLLEDGDLEENSLTGGENDFNVNLFTLDLIFSWNFAPGSEINLVWKNDLESYSDRPGLGYGENISDLLDKPTSWTALFKILYYLDYQYLNGKGK